MVLFFICVEVIIIYDFVKIIYGLFSWLENWHEKSVEMSLA